MVNAKKLKSFVEWYGAHITGDEKGQAQIFLDRLFQAMDQPACLDVDGQTEFRVRKAEDAGGGGAGPPQNHLDRGGHSRDFAQEQEERDGWRRVAWRRKLLPLDRVWVPDYAGLGGGAPFLDDDSRFPFCGFELGGLDSLAGHGLRGGLRRLRVR